MEEQAINPVEETNQTPQVEDVSQETNQEVTTETPQETPDQETPEIEPEQPKEKPTRAERRIKQLTEKLREKEEPVSNDTFGQQLPPWWSPTPNANEPENGELTMEQLNQKMMTVAQLAVAQDRQQRDFLSKVEGHSKELESIQDEPEFKDPKFDEAFTDLYSSINYDDKGNFKPKKSPTEVFEKLRMGYKMGQSQGQAETSLKMAQTIANAAVTPSAQVQVDPASQDRARFEEAKNGGGLQDWANYLKTKL